MQILVVVAGGRSVTSVADFKKQFPRHLSRHDTQSKVTIVRKKSFPAHGRGQVPWWSPMQCIDPPASTLVSMDANINTIMLMCLIMFLHYNLSIGQPASSQITSQGAPQLY